MSTLRPTEPLPPGVARWNWGAFLLNWIWGIGNNTFIALLALIPFVGFIVMIVLGVKGSEWAWRNKRWESVEHFRHVQRNWAVAGVLAWLLAIGLCVAAVWGMVAMVRGSDVYRLAVARLEANAEAVQLLGAPVSTGIPLGSVRIDGTAGEAQVAIPVEGRQARGTIFVEAVRDMGRWTLERIELEIEGREGRIDLNTGRRVLPPSPSDEQASLDRLAHVRPA